MAYIDAASSRVYARFYAYEGTIPALDNFMRYVMRYGVPLAVYTDKHTTYQSPVTPTSQFGRSLSELEIELIPARASPSEGAGRTAL